MAVSLQCPLFVNYSPPGGHTNKSEKWKSMQCVLWESLKVDIKKCKGPIPKYLSMSQCWSSGLICYIQKRAFFQYIQITVTVSLSSLVVLVNEGLSSTTLANASCIFGYPYPTWSSLTLWDRLSQSQLFKSGNLGLFVFDLFGLNWNYIFWASHSQDSLLTASLCFSIIESVTESRRDQLCLLEINQCGPCFSSSVIRSGLGEWMHTLRLLLP